MQTYREKRLAELDKLEKVNEKNLKSSRIVWPLIFVLAIVIAVVLFVFDTHSHIDSTEAIIICSGILAGAVFGMLLTGSITKTLNNIREEKNMILSELEQENNAKKEEAEQQPDIPIKPKKHFCAYCGSKAVNNAMFCEYCGNKL